MRSLLGVVAVGALCATAAVAPSTTAPSARHTTPVVVEHARGGLAEVVAAAHDPSIEPSAEAAAGATAAAVASETPGADATVGAAAGGGIRPNPPGMVNGTFPGMNWVVADPAEVRSAINAFRASRGLPALDAPYGSCADRGVVATPGFGLPVGSTHGQLIVAQNAGFFSGAPTSGGTLTVRILTPGISDVTGVWRPNAIALVRLYECGISQPSADDAHNLTEFVPDPAPPAPAPAPAPSPSAPPAPPSPAPAPDAPPVPAPDAPPAPPASPVPPASDAPAP